ncbi:uncharacterized protein ATC70_005466 [Mucor velutinosus]|uniref:Uncharacterized protein n=1 Tax=Mucor velutinosus TaxID=708070 RepID=A0AAN7DFE9_9FUNG|nr:hypothetical protein ATC70_005466 [Mucor velutinosus]
MTSIYDNIPALDTWYHSKNQGTEPYQVVPCVKQRTNSNTVSFSTAPPAVYCYENKQKVLERPLHRRNSSSEHVKELLKHYTSKLSRQLSNSSQSGYRRA